MGLWWRGWLTASSASYVLDLEKTTVEYVDMQSDNLALCSRTEDLEGHVKEMEALRLERDSLRSCFLQVQKDLEDLQRPANIQEFANK